MLRYLYQEVAASGDRRILQLWSLKIPHSNLLLHSQGNPCCCSAFQGCGYLLNRSQLVLAPFTQAWNSTWAASNNRLCLGWTGTSKPMGTGQPCPLLCPWALHVSKLSGHSAHLFHLIPASQMAGIWEAVLAVERRKLKRSATSFGKHDFCPPQPDVLEVRCRSQFYSLCKVLVRNTERSFAETVHSKPNCLNKYLRKRIFFPGETLPLAN